jgi:hypothetical protein
MSAPERFAAWLAVHEHRDRRYRHLYRYHPRSDDHSKILSALILEDLLQECRVLSEQAARGEVAYGINLPHLWPNGKRKTIDLAVGLPETLASDAGDVPGIRKAAKLSQVFVSCEQKTVMTEHGKSEPRLFDELGSSHEIVHQGSAEAIAAGITVVNIAATFISPLRQTSRGKLHVSKHKQPQVTESMVQHLRGLHVRENVGQVGFDAYCTFVVECDNIAGASLCVAPPAPQPGDRDHYNTFIARIARFYSERFLSPR